MKQPPQTLIVFTADFPFGLGEGFVLPDLMEFSKKFQKVFIISYNGIGGKKQDYKLPENVTVITRTPIRVSGLFYLTNIFWLLKIIFKEYKYAPDKKFFIRNFYLWMAKLRIAFGDMKFILGLNLPREKIMVSYWVNEWAIALSLLKQIDKETFFVCRSLGFDIWNDRNKGNYLPFRYLCYEQATGIFPNSMLAADYLKGLQMFPDRIFTSHLGTLDHGLADVNHNEMIHIVSASAIIPLKRVHLIPQSLAKLNKPVRWTHIGSGIDQKHFNHLIAMMEGNSNFEIIERVDNLPLFLKKLSPDIFISLSLSEGLPVTITEALSLGIPVIATDAGGTREIINEHTGVLLPIDVNIDQITGTIHTFIEKDLHKKLKVSARIFWEKNFFSETTNDKFYRQILKMYIEA